MDGHCRPQAVNAFYIEGGRLSPEDSRHAAKVLRLRPGDEIVALDGVGGRFLARLGEEGAVEILEALPANEPRVRLTVYQGVPKADKLEMLAQKLTELAFPASFPWKWSVPCAVLKRRNAGAKLRGRRPNSVAAPCRWKLPSRCRGKRL